MTLSLPQLWRSERPLQFVKFCCVGGSGVVVDMAILALLADPRFLGWNVLLSKICAAEAAMISNFIWNELWTFRPSLSASEGERAGVRCPSNPKSEIRNPKIAPLLRRFLTFNAICGIGIGLAVLLLHLFHSWLAWNLYLSNMLAIILVTFWNYGMNAHFNWAMNPQKQRRERTRFGKATLVPLWFCCPFALFLDTPASFGEQVRITGLLRTISAMEIVDPNGVKRPAGSADEKPFTLILEDCTWKLRTQFGSQPRGDTSSPRAYHEVSCDGTNIYWMLAWPTNTFDLLLSTNPNAQVVANMGKVTKGVVPVTSISMESFVTCGAPFIWFVFASSCYLNGLKDDRIRPIWITSDSLPEDPDFYSRMELIRAAQPPRLPVQATFVSSGMIKKREADGTWTTVRASAPFDKGWKLAEFESVGFTNIAQASFPTKARLTTFGRAPGAKTAKELKPGISFEIEALTIERLSEDDARHVSVSYPDVSGSLMVDYDERLSTKLKGPAVAYVASNGWLHAEEARYAALVADMPRREANERAKKQHSLSLKTYGLASFVVANVLLIAFGVWRTQRKKQQRERLPI